MQLKELWGTLVRRWYLAIAAVILTVAAGAAAVYLVGPTYETKGAILLVPPGTTVQQKDGNDTAIGNPFLALGGLSQARDIVIQAMTSKTTFEDLCTRAGNAEYQAMQAQLCKSRPGVKYEITPDFTSNAPIILVTVKADTAANAVTAVTTLTDEIPVSLADLQEEFDLRPRALITSLPVVVEKVPDVVHKSQIRATILAAGGVLALSLLAIALIDGLVGPRRVAPKPVPGESREAEDDPGVAEQPQDGDAGWGWTDDDVAPPNQVPVAEDEGPPDEAAMAGSPSGGDGRSK